LRDGDASSKFLNDIMSSRRRSNVVISIHVNGVQVEGVGVCNAIFQHFQTHFQSIVANRPVIDNLPFKSITRTEGLDLIKPFSLEEIEQAV